MKRGDRIPLGYVWEASGILPKDDGPLSPRVVDGGFTFDPVGSEAEGNVGYMTVSYSVCDVRVRTWLQDVDGDGNVMDDDNFSLVGGTDGSLWGSVIWGLEVSVPVDKLMGFASPEAKTIVVPEQDVVYVDYYYTRESYDLNLQAGPYIKKVTGDGTYLYEQEVTISAELEESTAEHSYTWDKWTKKTDEGEEDFATKQSGYKFTMPAEDLTLKANATESTNSYKQIIQKRYEKADGTFTEWEDVINKDIEYGKEFRWSVEAEGDYQAASIAPYRVTEDRTTRVTIYRKRFNVTVDKSTGISETTGTEEYRVGQTVTVTATPATGYSWKNWTSTDIRGSNDQTYEFTMPRKAVIITANATINTYNITYNLEGGTNNASNPANYTIETEAS